MRILAARPSSQIANPPQQDCEPLWPPPRALLLAACCGRDAAFQPLRRGSPRGMMRPPPMTWLVALLLWCASSGMVQAWPSLFKDCSIFPMLGQPQPRQKNHPPMAWVCEPHPPTTFEWCSANCAVESCSATDVCKQNCSKAACSCRERCMGSADVCTGAGGESSVTICTLAHAAYLPACL
jgi:hypothetical protein